jgi:hypothetical protein
MTNGTVTNNLTLISIYYGNALITTEYLTAIKIEVNISTDYTKANIQTLVDLSKFHSNKKNFKEMMREDLLLYLDSLRRREAIDPLHK